jgi:DMSO/TMAO reductase YedYZ heme-binding membrane subunit
VADTLWFVTRASGIVALVLMLAAVADGLIFSGRLGGRRARPAWLLDLHRGLGGYALIFTGLHVATAFGAGLGVTLASIFVPGAATHSRTGYTLGVVATYAVAVTVFTTWPKRRLRRRLWHAVHILSIPAAVLAAVHAYQLGTDAAGPVSLGLAALATGLVMYPAGLRLAGMASRRRASGTVPGADAAGGEHELAA